MPSSVEPKTSGASGRRGAAVRPGAMTRAMSALPKAGPRALRVAVVIGGRIESERVVRQGAGLTIGRLETSDVIVSEATSPPSHALFSSGEEGWRLAALPGMRVRVASIGGAEDLALTTPRTLTLGPEARGRIKLGATTLLFQLVDPPPKIDKPRLPASVSAGLFGETDWPFTMALTLAMMACFALFVGLDGADWPARTGITEAEIARAIVYFDEPEPPPEPAALMAQDRPPEPEQEVARNDDTSTVSEDRPERSRRDRSERPDRAPAQSAPVARLDPREIAAIVAQQLLLGMEGLPEDSAFHNLIEDGAPVADAAELLAGVTAVDVASNDQSVMRERGGSIGQRDRGLGTIARGDPSRFTARTAGEPLVETVPIGTAIPDEPVAEEPGLFDDRLVIRAMRARARRIQGCYEREMTASGGGIRGKVTVEFTIQPMGNVSGTRVVENTTGNRRLGQCVARHVGSVRFRQGPDSPAPYSFPWVFTPQQ